ncbi:MAG: Glycoprotein gp2 [Rhodospirillaceae bacterium]|nr:MAG: Glycoprotein gp2 [Rhodospirillaceae bacterium]
MSVVGTVAQLSASADTGVLLGTSLGTSTNSVNITNMRANGNVDYVVVKDTLGNIKSAAATLKTLLDYSSSGDTSLRLPSSLETASGDGPNLIIAIDTITNAVTNTTDLNALAGTASANSSLQSAGTVKAEVPLYVVDSGANIAGITTTQLSSLANVKGLILSDTTLGSVALTKAILDKLPVLNTMGATATLALVDTSANVKAVLGATSGTLANNLAASPITEVGVSDGKLTMSATELGALGATLASYSIKTGTSIVLQGSSDDLKAILNGTNTAAKSNLDALLEDGDTVTLKVTDGAAALKWDLTAGATETQGILTLLGQVGLETGTTTDIRLNGSVATIKALVTAVGDTNATSATKALWTEVDSITVTDTFANLNGAKADIRLWQGGTHTGTTGTAATTDAAAKPGMLNKVTVIATDLDIPGTTTLTTATALGAAPATGETAQKAVDVSLRGTAEILNILEAHGASVLPAGVKGVRLEGTGEVTVTAALLAVLPVVQRKRDHRGAGRYGRQPESAPDGDNFGGRGGAGQPGNPRYRHPEAHRRRAEADADGC